MATVYLHFFFNVAVSTIVLNTNASCYQEL